MDFTPRSLTQRTVDLELASQDEIDRFWGDIRSSEITLEELKNLLLRKGILTNFQLDRMLTGERLGFFYGH
jgi:serine/threonine-protein kinase